MNRSEFEDIELPPELAALDAELSSIRYEERPSFAPELEAELARTWRTVRHERHWPVRQLMAAGIAGLLVVGLGVPSARAALVRLVGAVRAPSQETRAPTTQPTVPLLPFDPPTIPGTEPVDPVPPRLRPPEPTEVRPTYEGPEVTFPELRDRRRTERAIQNNYPFALQTRGIGGTVRLLLWVDSVGSVDVANVAKASGVPELDRAAVQVAPSFQFVPARRRGKAVGTWVEFDVRFEPKPAESGAERGRSEPNVEPTDGSISPGGLSGLPVPEWREAVAPTAPGQREAGQALSAAIGDEELVRRLGPIEAILRGDPPAGAAPTQWRGEVADALEQAIARAPANPAPFLALARIRRKQGLRTEARVLYERGLQQAQREAGAVSPIVLADLYYERGLLVREGWLSARSAGRVPADALPAEACPQARSSGGGLSGYASADRLIAWNYLCPEALGEAFRTAFEASPGNAEADKTVMMASFRSAVEAYPAHPGANLEILLEQADEGRWDEVLDGARAFTRASSGNPYGILMEALALQRLSRTEEAEARFEQAFGLLSAEDMHELEDVSKLLNPAQSAQYWKASGQARQAWVEEFWETLDPILSTPVNERRVEHLARAAYAHMRFGSALSDPGEVWVRYGRPDQVRAIAEGSGLRTEFWDYGSGPDVTFRRVAASETMSLTSEARSYVDELRQVFPHRYGSGSRVVEPLPGQVARFRGAEPGASDVEVYTRVPQLRGTTSKDSLDLNVFLLGGEGETLDMLHRRIRYRPTTFSLKAPAAVEVSDVVFEIFNRRTGRAAVLRDSVHAAESATGATISDLLLTQSVRPSNPVERTAPWLQPLTLDEPVEGREVGVFVELYGVPAAAPSYRLHAEAVDVRAGRAVPLRIRPAGEGRFRTAWDLPAVDGVDAQFLNVSISDLPSGRYRLRLIADLTDAGTSLVSERIFEKR